MALQSTVVTLSKFGDPKDRPYQDKQGGEVKNHNALLPRPIGFHAGRRGVSQNPVMKNGDCSDKARKEEDLDSKTDENDILATVKAGFIVRGGKNASSY